MPKAKKAAPKKLKDVHATLLLDETSSMGLCKFQTISGFNEYIKTLQDRANKECEICLTLVTFNSEKRKTIYRAKKIEKVEPLTDESYQPAAITPLYDAIGATMNQIENYTITKGMDTLFIILTDGEENASKEFSRSKIFGMIKEKEKLGWTFVFLGADRDSWLAHQQLGVIASNTMNYKGGQHVNSAMKRTAIATVNYLSNPIRASKSPVMGFYDNTPEEDDDTSA